MNALIKSWLFILFVALFGQQAVAQETIEIQTIYDNPDSYLNEVVIIEGFVEQYFPKTSTSSAHYLIKDDMGGIIGVRTTKGQPEVGKRYTIRGPVSYDPNGVGPSVYYISEDSRNLAGTSGGSTSVSDTPRSQEASSGTETDNSGSGFDTMQLLLILGIALIVILIIILVVALMKKQGGGPAGGKSTGTTVKMTVPPPGTLKVLPGRFEVKEGDPSQKELRFFKTKDQLEQEVTFGRDSGPKYTHIKLESPTVSKKQAKVLFSNGTYTMINFAPESSNPTMVNGTPLGVGESKQLNEGDTISMGEVVFEFHAQ